jgi:glycerol uptake facilitator-like aquaporin
MDVRKLVAEFLGTALLVIFAVGVATLSLGAGPEASAILTTALPSVWSCWVSPTLSARSPVATSTRR